MKHGLLESVGVLLLLVTGCTEASSPLSSPSSAPSASSSPPPPEPGPARPLGAAAVTLKDARLVDAYSSGPRYMGHVPPPPSGAAVLRRRTPAGTGDVAWMPDANTYCLMAIRDRAKGTECFRLPAKRKVRGYVKVGIGKPHGLAEPGQMWLTVSVVEKAKGPFGFTDGTPEHATPVQEATMRFPSGRTMMFLTYEFPEGYHLPDVEICNADRTVCFEAFDWDGNE